MKDNYFIISELVDNAVNNKLMKIFHREKNILFTHAGITKTWLSNIGLDKSNVDELNDYFLHKPSLFKFTLGVNKSSYGDDVTQPPIWIRPNSLLIDKLDDYTQVVGHTSFENIIHNNGVFFIDTLEYGYYLVINKNRYIIKNIYDSIK